MSIVTGLSGVFLGQGTVRSFNVRELREAIEWSASGAAGIKSQIAGNKDWNGSASMYGYVPAVMPGAGFTFKGQTDSASTGKAWTGTAIMDTLSVTCNTEAAQPLECSIGFSGNGDVSTTTTVITDATAPSVYSSISCGADFAGTAIKDVRSWTMNIASDNKRYASSETAGQYLRKAGNKSGTVTVTNYQADVTDVLVPGVIDVLKLYVTSTLFWQLSYCQLEDWDTVVDIETGDITGVSYSFKYSAFKLITGTWTQGTIINPATTAYYP